MGKFRVTAVQKVVETFIEAPDKETAWDVAKNDSGWLWSA